jgi:hypothetical protein
LRYPDSVHTYPVWNYDVKSSPTLWTFNTAFSLTAVFYSYLDVVAV